MPEVPKRDAKMANSNRHLSYLDAAALALRSPSSRHPFRIAWNGHPLDVKDGLLCHDDLYRPYVVCLRHGGRSSAKKRKEIGLILL
jgi:hypothetical protein